jgi:hypothetical protein
MSLYGTSNAFGKDIWLDLMDGFNHQLERQSATLLNLLPKDEVALEGRRQYVKLRIGDSLGGSVIDEGGDFATPGDVTWDEGTLSLSLENHVIEFTTHEMALLRSSSGAARDVVAEKMEAAMDAVTRSIERQAHMDGTGVMAKVSSSSGSTITLSATTTSQVDRDRFVWIDDAKRHRYDVVHGTTGAQQVTGFTVDDINESTNVLTCSTTMTAATSSGVVVRSGNWASGGVFRSLEFPGLLAAIDDSNTYLGINRTAPGKAYFKSYVNRNSGTLRPLTTALIHTLRNRVARRALGAQQPSEGNGYCYYCSPGVWTEAHELMAPALRYSTDVKPDIGFAEFDLMGVPCYEGIHAPKNNLFLIHKPSFKFLRAKHERTGLMEWWTLEGGQSSFPKGAAVGQGYAAAEQKIMQGLIGLYTVRPRNHGRITDITENASAY